MNGMTDSERAEFHKAKYKALAGQATAKHVLKLSAKLSTALNERNEARADAERWAAEANRCDDLMCGWVAACAFIDSHVGDPDMTDEMVRSYAEFQKWREHLKKTPNVNLTGAR